MASDTLVVVYSAKNCDLYENINQISIVVSIFV